MKPLLGLRSHHISQTQAPTQQIATNPSESTQRGRAPEEIRSSFTREADKAVEVFKDAVSSFVSLLGGKEAAPTAQSPAQLGSGMAQRSLTRLMIDQTSRAAATEAIPSRPPLQALQLRGSVGQGGENNPEDIRQVQTALQALGYLPPGEPSGVVDKTLQHAIARYQTDNDLPVVDGRIDVGKSTMRHINNIANGNATAVEPKDYFSDPQMPTFPGFAEFLSSLLGQNTPGEATPGQMTPGQTAPQTPNSPGQVAPQAPMTPGQTTPQIPTTPVQTRPNTPSQPTTPATPTTPVAPTTPATPTIPTTPVEGPRPTAPTGPLDSQLSQLQERSVLSALQEWQNGVRESGGRNRGPRVDDYARAARMSLGGEWCGFFTGFNYKQNGFKHTSHLASYQKARDFFMYRDYTSKTGSAKNAENDQTRLAHEQAGSARQYFMLQESPTIDRVNRNGSWGKQRYGHFDAAANTFNYQNLPIRAGDTALFSHGHVGMVESYNPATGRLVTVEGNTSGMGPDGQRRSQAVVRKEYDLTDPAVRRKFDGFGRPSALDFEN